jgi:hypothetical protein
VPVLVAGVGAAVIGYLLMPLTVQVMAMNPPPNVPPEQYQNTLPMIEKSMRIMSLASPLLVAIKLLILAGILKLMATLGGLDVVFKKLFSLVANAGMIIFLEGLATFAVIKAKAADIQTMEDMMPALGLDLLIHGQFSKPSRRRCISFLFSRSGTLSYWWWLRGLGEVLQVEGVPAHPSGVARPHLFMMVAAMFRS